MRNRSQGDIFLRRQNIPIFLFQIDNGILVEKKGSQKNSHERQANGDMKNISVQNLEKLIKRFFWKSEAIPEPDLAQDGRRQTGEMSQ